MIFTKLNIFTFFLSTASVTVLTCCVHCWTQQMHCLLHELEAHTIHNVIFYNAICTEDIS